jgi:hypothetical protein
MSPSSTKPLAAALTVCRRETPLADASRWATFGAVRRLILSRLILACLITAPVSRVVSAALVIDPSDGTLLTNGREIYAPGETDAAIPIPLSIPFGGRFFGEPAPQTVYASDNGNLAFTPEGGPNGGGDIFYFYPNQRNTVARISPLWDDFLFAQDENDGVNNRIVWEHRLGAFLAVTWLNVRLDMEAVFEDSFPATDRSFQSLWFEADTLIRGFEFKADDIVFSYVAHIAGTGDFGDLYARVALDKGDGDGDTIAGTTAFPSFSHRGDVYAEDGESFPGRRDDFLLYRWNAEIGNYDVSIRSFTAVPEPSSMLMLATIAVAGFASASRRRKRRASTE